MRWPVTTLIISSKLQNIPILQLKRTTLLIRWAKSNMVERRATGDLVSLLRN